MNKENLLSFCNGFLNITGKNLNNGCVVAVGGFDGMHLGHIALIKALTDEAKRLSVPAVIFTFDYNDTPKDKTQMLLFPNSIYGHFADNGADIVITAPFSKIKDMSAADFVLEFLYKELNAKGVICGYDFRFGNNREGDAQFISSLLSPMGVSVTTVPPVMLDGEPISATRIRALVAKGDIKQANKLLYKQFGFVGPVIHGAKLGRKLGFPTINQEYPETMVKPPYGVYLTKAVIEGNEYYGVTNFGTKPTVSDAQIPTCETYVFNYNGDSYRKVVRLYFLDFIRHEKRFNSVDELKAQVEKDKIAAQKILSKGELQ